MLALGPITASAALIAGPSQIVSVTTNATLTTVNGGATTPNPTLRDGVVSGVGGTFVELVATDELPGAILWIGMCTR